VTEDERGNACKDLDGNERRNAFGAMRRHAACPHFIRVPRTSRCAPLNEDPSMLATPIISPPETRNGAVHPARACGREA
jgi:hypothetical protein